jgi:hypothetical protein
MQNREATNAGRKRIVFEDPVLATKYATIFRDDDPTVDGTPLDVDTLLKNATAILYGFDDPEDTVPDDIFNEIYTRLTDSGTTVAGLQTALTEEIERATGVEGTIAGNLASEITRAKGKEDAIAGNLASEITRAKGIESGLQDEIDTEETRAAAVEEALQTQISNEATARQTAVSIVSGNLTNEVTRAKNAEAALQADIAAETARAKSAEQANATAIGAEETRAKGAESAISQTVTQNYTVLNNAISQNATNISNEIDRAAAAEQTIASGLQTETTARQNNDIVAVGITSANALVLTAGNGETVSTTVPIADDATDGFMAMGDWEQLQTNTANIATYMNGHYVGAYLGASPTQGEIETAWTNVMGGLSAPIGAVVVNLDQDPPRGHDWLKTHGSGGDVWYDRGGSLMPVATNTSLGVVMGRNANGKIFVESDGTMSLVGYDNLVQAITNNTNNKADKITTIAISGDGTAPALSLEQSRTLQLTLSNTGVTAGAYGEATAKTLTFGGTFKVLRETVNAKGLLTAAASVTLTMPTLPTVSASQAGLMTTALFTKLGGIAAGAEVNVQSDWNQETTTADDYIKNKPSLLQLGTGTPSPLGTASAGSAATAAPFDHVHAMPTYSDVGAQPLIATGTNAQYYRGDKTWADFGTAARAVALTGLSTSSNVAITSSDTLLTSSGKLQAQITALGTSVAGKQAQLSGTGFVKASGTTVSYDNTTYLSTSAFATKLAANAVNGIPLSDGGVNIRYFGTSATAAATVQKEVSIPAITALETGTVIYVLPSVTSTVASSTLKLNDFSAYPMRYNNAAITTTSDSVVWTANVMSVFIFDGTYWQFVAHGLDSNTVYSAITTAEITAGTATTSRVVRADYLKAGILGTALTGLSTETNAAITATDTLLSAAGKLQAQITERASASRTVNGYALTDDVTVTQESNVTIAPDEWSGTSAPYSYSFANSATSASSTVIVGFPADAAQLEAWNAAKVVSYAMTASQCTIQATGEKPSVSVTIPVIFIRKAA